MTILGKLNIFKRIKALEEEVTTLKENINALEGDIIDGLVTVSGVFNSYLEKEKAILLKKEHKLVKIGKNIQYSNLNNIPDLDVE